MSLNVFTFLCSLSAKILFLLFVGFSAFAGAVIQALTSFGLAIIFLSLWMIGNSFGLEGTSKISDAASISASFKFFLQFSWPWLQEEAFSGE